MKLTSRHWSVCGAVRYWSVCGALKYWPVLWSIQVLVCLWSIQVLVCSWNIEVLAYFVEHSSTGLLLEHLFFAIEWFPFHILLCIHFVIRGRSVSNSVLSFFWPSVFSYVSKFWPTTEVNVSLKEEVMISFFDFDVLEISRSHQTSDSHFHVIGVAQLVCTMGLITDYLHY